MYIKYMIIPLCYFLAQIVKFSFIRLAVDYWIWFDPYLLLGEQIDSIASHIERAEGDVEQGKKHLKSAEEKQKAARKKKICLFSTLFIVLLIVVIVILAEFGAFSSSGSDTETVKVVEKVVYVTVTPATTESSSSSSSSSTISPESSGELDQSVSTTAAP